MMMMIIMMGMMLMIMITILFISKCLHYVNYNVMGQEDNGEWRPQERLCICFGNYCIR